MSSLSDTEQMPSCATYMAEIMAKQKAPSACLGRVLPTWVTLYGFASNRGTRLAVGVIVWVGSLAICDSNALPICMPLLA